MALSKYEKTKNWDADLYDGKHSYVSQYGESLLKLLDPKPNEIICDIGCGTGDLAKQILESGAQVLGIDKSESMINEAKNKYSDIQFKTQDIKAFHAHQKFDAIFSNATLHWIKQPEQAIMSIFNAIKPGGRFVAELGGQDNIKCIVDGINSALDYFNFSNNKGNNPWYFPSVSEYTSILEKQGFIVREVVYYDRPTKLEGGEEGLQNWLKMFAGFFFENVPLEIYNNMLTHIEDKCQMHLFKNGEWFADYKRLRIKVEK